MRSGSICEMRAVSASGPPSVQPTVSEPNRPSDMEADASAFTCAWSAGVRKDSGTSARSTSRASRC